MRSAAGRPDESSKALVAAAKRLSSARAALAAAQRRLAVAQKAADAAARRRRPDAGQAPGRRAPARAGPASRWTRPRKRVADQRAAIGRLAASNYANGDPALMGLSVMLNSQDPRRGHQQMNTVDCADVDKQTTLLDSLEDGARPDGRRGGQGRAGPRRGRRTTQGRRAENLVRKQALERSAAAGPRRGRHPGRPGPRRRGRRRPRPPRRPAPAAGREEAGEPDPPADHRASRRQHGGYQGDTGGFLFRPVPGYVTSPYG